MKKITLLLATMITSVAFSQTLTLNSLKNSEGVETTTFLPGDVVTIDVTWAGVVAPDTFRTIQTGIAGESPFFYDQDADANTGPSGMANEVYTYTIPAGVADGDTFLELIFQVNTAAGTTFPANANTAVTIDSTLSSDSFTQDNISASISQSEGVINIGSDIETTSYKLYDLSGAKVIDQAANGSINVSGLSSGVYILATDAGLTKVAF
ncbi:T9SS type A sorting domain-containing protein [Aquimarina agarilytica]|uniref:T9SS type A sorting domain-containing protein n=1 Tax=Aquimarina agarilytica TaxID=1087449 RepID=UPI000289C51D|nr:T9SS type A sorting domain-containing protein [Aquimarina agarilytica]